MEFTYHFTYHGFTIFLLAALYNCNARETVNWVVWLQLLWRRCYVKANGFSWAQIIHYTINKERISNESLTLDAWYNHFSTVSFAIYHFRIIWDDDLRLSRVYKIESVCLLTELHKCRKLRLYSGFSNFFDVHGLITDCPNLQGVRGGNEKMSQQIPGFPWVHDHSCDVLC